MAGIEAMEAQQELLSAALEENFVATDVSFEDYLTRFDGKHAEWVLGNVVVYMSNNAQHQRIILFLANLLNLYLGFRQIGQLILASFTMFVGKDKPAREPDLMIVLNENSDRIQKTYLNGPADIAIEIVSPESSMRDYGVKFHEYEAVGVREYWLFDPIRQQADIHVLQADQHYHRAALDAQGRLISTLLPGFALDPNVLWRENLPNGNDLIALVQQMTT
jgi:Uma2 family endonuclease